MSWIPGISQVKSLFQLVTGDSDGAKKTQEEFLDTWENHKLGLLSDLADNIPVVGHIKGAIHHAMGDEEAAIKSEECATRTLVVMGAAALVAGTGGTAAPILAGVAAGVLADGVLTGETNLFGFWNAWLKLEPAVGIETARHDGKYDPQGMVAVGTNVVRDIQRGKNPTGDIFDGVVIAAGDGLIGASKVKGSAGEPKTRIYRVEGRSLERLRSGANPVVEEFQVGDNQRIVHENSRVQARPNMGPRGLPRSLIPDIDEVGELEELQPRGQEEQVVAPEYEDYLHEMLGIVEDGAEDGEVPPEYRDYLQGMAGIVDEEDERAEVRERPENNRRARQREAQTLFLNMGQGDRAYAYFAQKVINHARRVKEYRRLGADGSELITKKTHSIRIKSFEVYTRDLTSIEEDAITEGHRNALRKGEAQLPEDKGVLRVDTTKAPRQYGLESHRYTPVFDNAIPGSYLSESPWIKHLPIRVLELIRDYPVAVGKIRRIQYRSFAVSQVGGAMKPVPIAQLKNITTEQITSEDVEPAVVAHCRHVKTITGATKTTPPDWDEHFEYLVKFKDDSSAEWYPGELLAPDLRKKFYERAKASAKPVGLLQGYQDGKHHVQRPDGSIDTVSDYQIFWDQKDSDVDELSGAELDKILDHLHKEHDLRGIRVLQQKSDTFPLPRVTGVAPCVNRDGVPVYFATAINFKGGSHPCKVIGHTRPSVKAGYDWKEYEHSGTYDILPFLPELMELVTSRKGQVPPGRVAVKGGAEADGRPLYHAVGNIGDLRVPGKVAPHLEGGFLPHDGEETHVDECKIL